MKKYVIIGMLGLLLGGCSKQTALSNATNSTSSETSVTEVMATSDNTTITTTKMTTVQSTTSETSTTVLEKETVIEEQELLTQYDDLSIEYARIWIQLGPNPDIDRLYVTIIPEGTLINPYLPSGAVYPETVTQLSGSRLVDGAVTYSSNRDGTINVYHVPKRFDTPDFDQIPEEDYIAATVKMATETEHVAISTFDDQLVIFYIQLIQQ